MNAYLQRALAHEPTYYDRPTCVDISAALDTARIADALELLASAVYAPGHGHPAFFVLDPTS